MTDNEWDEDTVVQQFDILPGDTVEPATPGKWSNFTDRYLRHSFRQDRRAKTTEVDMPVFE